VGLGGITGENFPPAPHYRNKPLKAPLTLGHFQKQTKWNFDFKEERPLEGRWEWERVETTSGSPAPGDADGSAEGAKGEAGKQAP
jgi:hypothetical protein